MIAGKRARKRSLIRSNALMSTNTGAQSSMGGVSAFQRGSSDLGHITPLSQQAMPAMQKELTVYLRQLSTLHTAGILTDEEFSAARGRLLGS